MGVRNIVNNTTFRTPELPLLFDNSFILLVLEYYWGANCDTLCPVLQGEHLEDSQGAGGGHQAISCWSRIQPGETCPGRSVLSQDHHPAHRGCQTGSDKHGLRRPRDTGD